MRHALCLYIPNRNMDPKDILAEYYGRDSKAFDILVAHGEHVARKALVAAEQVSHLKPDLEFITNAAMLHDIGILETDSPELGCNGRHPYICHGILGRELMENIELPEFGLICECHLGVGISADDVQKFNCSNSYLICKFRPSRFHFLIDGNHLSRDRIYEHTGDFSVHNNYGRFVIENLF